MPRTQSRVSILLRSSVAALAAPALVVGTPLLAHAASPPITFATGLSTVVGVAVDSSYVYMSDVGTGKVYAVPTGSATPLSVSTLTPIATGIYGSQLAVDQSGNVFAADATSGIWRIAAVTHAKTLISPATSGSSDSGVGVDQSGNVYYTDLGTSTLHKLTPHTSGTTTTYSNSTIATGLPGPDQAAVDYVGNVYVLEAGTSQVDKFTVTNNYARSTVANTGGAIDTGLAVDPLGDVAVVSEVSSGTVVADTLTGTPTQSTVASVSPGTNITVALDRSGNVFITSITKVLEVIGGVTLPSGEPGGGNTGPGGTATPELGSGQLMATGTLPILGALLYRRRRARRRVQESDDTREPSST